MLTHPTLDQLRALKLDGMADAFVELEQQDAARDLTHAEWLALLLDREIANRTTKRTQIRLRAARLRYSQASVEDVNYRAQRQLDKALSSPPAAGLRKDAIFSLAENAASAKPGSLAPSLRGPAARATARTTPACRASSHSWSSPMGMVASLASSVC
jgi:IstB-like ATP binding protein